MSDSASPRAQRKPLLSNVTYDVMKHVVTLVLPSLGALYYGLAQIWGLPKAEEVVGTIAAVNTFLGIVMGLSTMTYNKSDVKYDGSIDVMDHPDDGSKMYSLNLNSDPLNLHTMQAVTFKVNNNGN